MKKCSMKRKIAAILCAMMLGSFAVPAAAESDLVTLIVPPSDSAAEADAQNGQAESGSEEQDETGLDAIAQAEMKDEEPEAAAFRLEKIESAAIEPAAIELVEIEPVELKKAELKPEKIKEIEKIERIEKIEKIEKLEPIEKTEQPEIVEIEPETLKKPGTKPEQEPVQIQPELKIEKKAEKKVELILPPQKNSDELKRFALTASESDGRITASISGAEESREIEIWVAEGDSFRQTAYKTAVFGDGTADLGVYAEGSYMIYADYVSPQMDDSFNSLTKKSFGPLHVDGGQQTVMPAEPSIKTITGSVKKTESSITVSITADPAFDRVIDVTGPDGYHQLVKLDVGKSAHTFKQLAPGTYEIYADYEDAFGGITPFESSVTIEEEAAGEEQAAIAITKVSAGENSLTVKGTAQPGAQILIQAEPAGVHAEVLVVGKKGRFETKLSADPGTYTKVSVFYVTDVTSLVSKSGKWTVTAVTAEPDIEVDPIDNHSTTVVVETGANLKVTLKTPDSTQTVWSDAQGLAHFSLTHKYLKGEEFVITVVYGDGKGQKVTKKVTVDGVVDYSDLEYGDYGEAVLRLTTRLHALGYPVSPTKNYNSTVREAVRLFQMANGQEADGEAGDRMQSALYSVSAIAYGSDRYPTLVRGDKGLTLIRTLQQRLKELGYYTISVDGVFGSGTQRAVRLFQQVNGLPDTGVADNATQVLLYSSAAKPLDYGTTGGYQTLERSDKYRSAVVPLQRRLVELGYYAGSVDGYFGSKTVRAVRNFQNRNGLPVTGVADSHTQQVLYSAAAKKYDGTVAGSSSSPSLGYRLLYWGCRGEEVVRLQNALISAGYKKLVREADGIFGQWTYDAVRAYQKDHGLAVDGIAGKKTQNALYGTSY